MNKSFVVADFMCVNKICYRLDLAENTKKTTQRFSPVLEHFDCLCYTGS